MGSSIGVIIGVVVLLVSIGFVVLMMVGEWSQSGEVKEADVPAALPKAPASAPASRRAAPKKKAAPKAAKKKAAVKSKKK